MWCVGELVKTDNSVITWAIPKNDVLNIKKSEEGIIFQSDRFQTDSGRGCCGGAGDGEARLHLIFHSRKHNQLGSKSSRLARLRVPQHYAV